MLSEEESFHPRLPHLPRRQDQAVGDWKTTENKGSWANMLQAGIFNPTDFTYKWTLVNENNFKTRRATWFPKFSPTCPHGAP